MEQELNRLITQRFCSAANKNMPMEILCGSQGRTVRCLSEEDCKSRWGGCQNCLRKFWR